MVPHENAILTAELEADVQHLIMHTKNVLRAKDGRPWPPERMKQGLQGAGSAQAYLKKKMREKPSDSAVEPVKQGYAELTFEWIVLRPQYAPLFTVDERAEARQRLVSWGVFG